jgi:hypothetical protein
MAKVKATEETIKEYIGECLVTYRGATDDFIKEFLSRQSITLPLREVSRLRKEKEKEIKSK